MSTAKHLGMIPASNSTRLPLTGHVACTLCLVQVKAGGMGTAKDLEMSPFEAARKLLTFEAENLSLT